MEDPYLILGVNPTDDFKIIRKKYIELCRKYHPDKVGTNEFLELIKKINNAYEKIKNEKENNNNNCNNNNEKKEKNNFFNNEYEEDRAEEDEAEAYQKFFNRTGGKPGLAYFLMGTQMYRKKRTDITSSSSFNKNKQPTLFIKN